MLDIVGLTSVAHQRAGKYSLGMGQRLGIAGALLGDPGVLLFDEPVNGLDPEGIRWVRHLLRDRAAEGRTVFVSSHLITEMSLTAEQLVVIGRGTLIAETSVKDFVARSTGAAVRLVTPVAGDFAAALTRSGATVTVADDGALIVEGMTSAQIGDLAARTGSRSTSSPPCGHRSRTPSWSSPTTPSSTAARLMAVIHTSEEKDDRHRLSAPHHRPAATASSRSSAPRRSRSPPCAPPCGPC